MTMRQCRALPIAHKTDEQDFRIAHGAGKRAPRIQNGPVSACVHISLTQIGTCVRDNQQQNEHGPHFHDHVPEQMIGTPVKTHGSSSFPDR